MEIYKRLEVELSYKESFGIQLKNKESNIQIDEEVINIIGKKKIKDHQFPLNVTKKDGYVLTKPESW